MAMEQQGLPVHMEAILALPEEHQRLAMLSLGRRFSDREMARLLETSIQKVKNLRKELGIEKGYRGKIVSVAGEDPANVPTPEPEEIFAGIQHKVQRLQEGRADDNGRARGAPAAEDGRLGASEHAQFCYIISGSEDTDSVAARMAKLAELIQTLNTDVVEFDVSIRA